MKQWNYSVSSNSVWTSFDYGTVEAETYEEALEKAKAELKENFDKVNEILNSQDETFTIDYDERYIEITLID